jgi:hypothetical protein
MMVRSPVVNQAILACLALGLGATVALAAPGPLEKAFLHDARSLQQAAGKPEALVHWLVLQAWRPWVPAEAWSRAMGAAARAVRDPALAPLISLEKARALAGLEHLEEAAALAASAGWVGCGTLRCEGAGWGGAAAEQDVRLGAGLEGLPGLGVRLPPYVQPLPLELWASEPRGACSFEARVTAAHTGHLTVGLDANPGAVLRVDGLALATLPDAGPLLPDGTLVDVLVAAGEHRVVVDLPLTESGQVGRLYLRLALDGEGLAQACAQGKGWLTAVPPEAPRGPARLRPSGGVAGGTQAALEGLAAGDGERGCSASLLLGRHPEDPFCGALVLRRKESRALTRRKDDPVALFFYGLVLLERGQAVEAGDVFQHVRAKAAPFPEAEVAYWGLLAERGLGEVARRGLAERLPRGAAWSPWGAQELWRMGGASGPGGDRPLDRDLALVRASALLDRGDAAGALELLEAVSRAFPGNPGVEVARARALAATGGDVLAALAIPLLVGGPGLLEVAQVLDRVGHVDQAREALGRYLALHPDSTRGRLLARVLGRSAGEGADPWFGPVEPARLRALLTARRAEPGTGVVGVSEARRREYDADATSREVGRIVLARVDADTPLPRGYTLRVRRDVETLDVLRARVFKARGGWVDVLPDRFDVLRDQETGVVDEDEQVAVPLEDLEPGDLLVLDYARGSRGTPGLRDRPSDVLLLRREYPVLESRVEVAAPAAWPLRAAVVSQDGRALREESSANGVHTVRVTARDLPGWGDGELDDYLVFTTYGTWSELGYRYASLFAGKGPQPTEGLWALAVRLTDRTRDRAERIAALHRWVSDSIRYFGVELDRHAYEPYAPGVVLRRGYGDCKDKSALLAALLDRAGVRAVPVLVASGNAPAVDLSLPLLDAFDHLLLYLPDDHLYLDPTLPHTPAGFLPAHVAGRPALVLDGGHPEPDELPEQAADANALLEDLTWSRADGDRWRVEGSLELSGELAFPLVGWQADDASRERELPELLRRLYPLLDVKSAQAGLTTRGSLPVATIRFQALDSVVCRGVPDQPGARACRQFERPPQGLRGLVPAWDRAYRYAYRGSFTFPVGQGEAVKALVPFFRKEVAGALLRTDSALDDAALRVRVTYRQEKRDLEPRAREALESAWQGQPAEVRIQRGRP